MGSLFATSQQPPVCSSAAHAGATAYPRWTLLAPHGGGPGDKCNITGDTKTMASASTSSGHRIVVSVCREPSSPALSRICLCFRPVDTPDMRFPGTELRFPATPAAYYTVVAAHGGSVLLHIASTEYSSYMEKPNALDYFVYTNAAGAASDLARPPPSLRLLPPLPSTAKELRWGSYSLLDVRATGFLCRGEADEFVVAQLKMLSPEAKDDGDDADPEAELLLFRDGEWRVERPLVVHRHGSDGDLLLAKWMPEAVVPVGGDDGVVLCWVDFSGGVVLSDVLRQTDVLWYVPYPAEARPTDRRDHQCFVCTNSRGELKLVGVSPRRCSHCGCSQHATAVDAWTFDTRDMAWVLETGTTRSMVHDDDDSELWALEKHSRQHLVYPVQVACMNGGGGLVVSDESAAPPTTTMEEEDEQMPARRKRKKHGPSKPTV